MKNPQSDHILRQMVQRLVQRFDPEQIILFGSRARGQARPNSDYDLLVVMPLTGSKRAQQVAMRVALHDFDVPKDVIVVTPEEVARQRNIVGALVRPAVREGKVLYMFEIDDEVVHIVRQWGQVGPSAVGHHCPMSHKDALAPKEQLDSRLKRAGMTSWRMCRWPARQPNV